MTYRVVEIFKTVQGEGRNAGEPAVFIRFAGCNAWDGHPEHRGRSTGACGDWCDTDFRNGTPMTAYEICERVVELAGTAPAPWIVLTGGEPLLSVDAELVKALRAYGSVAVETNGSKSVDGIPFDWVTVSPKLGMPLLAERADEVKVILPGGRADRPGWSDEKLEELESRFPGAVRYLQPLDPPTGDLVESGALTRFLKSGDFAGQREQYEKIVQDCVERAWRLGWKVSVQGHKLLGVR